MHAAARRTTISKGISGSGSNVGRRQGSNRFLVEAHSKSSRIQRAGLFKKRQIGFRGLEEESSIATNHELSDRHNKLECVETYTQEASKMKSGIRAEPGPISQPPRVAPGLLGMLIVAVLMLNCNLQPGTPVAAPSAPKVQSMVSILAYAASIVSLVAAARLLQALRLARKMPLRPDAEAKKIIGSALLVAGGTVGAGIVALPVKTAAVGLLPSAAGLIAGWAYMLLTAFIIVEVSERCGGANFTRMAEMTLGRQWKAVSGALYMFVYCATLTAYIAESATFLGPFAAMAFGQTLPPATLSVLFTVVFGGVIAMGSKAVDTINGICVLVAMTAFLVLVVLGSTGLSPASLLFCNWAGAIQTVPIMIVAFTYHNMIPSLLGYLKSAAAVRKALFIGTSIPLAMYLVWEVLILGSLPPGTTLASVAEVVERMGSTGLVPAAINVFSLFAIVTSFLGVGMGCLDFVEDLVGRPNTGKGKGSCVGVVATMALPLAIACLCPKLFVAALELSGILRLVLFAIIPVAMLRAGVQASGGRRGWIGAAVAFIAIAIICIDVVGKLAPVILYH
ncbi:hypothetical protein BSKO_02940 [Bryopsis sp. KO-2023]|nr:hypothetical protein BSKO_02940 [Bryopsis sp. KO-2023]